MEKDLTKKAKRLRETLKKICRLEANFVNSAKSKIELVCYRLLGDW